MGAIDGAPFKADAVEAPLYDDVLLGVDTAAYLGPLP